MTHDDETNDSQMLLAAAAGAAGMIGLVTLGLELATGRWFARVVGIAPLFVSTPLGIGTVALGGWIARDRPTRAIPVLILGLLYWATLLICW